MLEPLLERFRTGDRLALARLLSVVARGEGLGEVFSGLVPKRPSRIVAITGSAGVGKSTLVGKLIEHIRSQSQSVAVLACDPQSPLTGGALLGDRFRMPSRADDDGVFIRSVAAAGGQSAVASHVDMMLRVLQAFGFDVILLETVGAGQGDTAVHELADIVVLLLQPETGDDLQWEKAGVLEVADIVIVHKADMPAADHVEKQIKAMLELSPERPVHVLKVSSKTGEGIAKLWETISKATPGKQRCPSEQRSVLHSAKRLLMERLTGAANSDPRVQRLFREWQDGRLSDDDAVSSLCQFLADPPRHTA